MKHIFFDLDNTLFDFNKAERIALEKTLIDLNITPTDDILSRYSEINISRWKLMELGKITREEVKLSRYKILFAEFSIDAPYEKATPIYEKYLSQGHYFIDGAEDVIKKIHGKYHLYIASNGTTSVQKGRIGGSIIPLYFDKIFISQELGVNKPDKGFFDCCFSRIDGFKKEDAVIIGDSLSSDILGGKNAKIKTIWFNPNACKADIALPDYEISHLSQIPSLLERIF